MDRYGGGGDEFGGDEELYEELPDDDSDDGGDDLEEVARSAFDDGYATAESQAEVDREFDALERKYPGLRGGETQEAVVSEAARIAQRAGIDPSGPGMPEIVEQVARGMGLEARGGSGGRQPAADRGDSIVESFTAGQFRLHKQRGR